MKKKTLLEIEHINVESNKYHNLSFKEAVLSFDSDIDLSSIKSLSMNIYTLFNLNLSFYLIFFILGLKVEAKISDLSAFVNLEYLFFHGIKLCQSPFQNLKQLIKIEANNCDVSEFDFDSLNSLTSLQIIDVDSRNKENSQYVSLKIDLNRLINLKCLELKFIKEHEVNNLELITDDSYNQLTYVRVNNLMIDFSKQLYLPELNYLNISNVDLSQQLNQHSFNGMSNLNELDLKDTNLKNVDFLGSDRLGNLEILNLSHNQIIDLRKGAFSKLKKLKWLDLSSNQIKELIPGVFEGLECLEHLNISSNLLDYSKPIDKTVFCMSSLIELNMNKSYLKNVDFLDTDGLRNLEKLNLSKNQITVLRNGAFSKLKKLKVLDLSSNQIKELIPGVFEGLECLEHLNIRNNNINVESIDKKVFDVLKLLKDLYISNFKTVGNVEYLKRDGLNVY